MRTLRWLFLVWLMLVAQATQAQFTLTGVARDSLTQEPLGFASVFLANTTYGATTDEAGRFSLPGVAAGKYDFVVSYLGYQLYQRPINVRGPQTINPLLAPTNTRLQEVIVQGRRHRNKPADYLRFTELFIGTTFFSQQCKILNAEDVVVDFDARRNLLTATSSNFVQVENRALGYLVTYYGLRFAADLNQQTVTFFGQPVFAELPVRNARQQQQWQQNRRRAYFGSVTHFLRAVHDNQVTAQGYLAQRTWQATKSGPAPTNPLPQQQRAEAGGQPFVFSDSLRQSLAEPRFYRYLQTRPLPADSLRRQAADGTFWLRFRDQVQVTYQPERPDPRYRPASPPGSEPLPLPTAQVSTLYLLQPEARLLPSGQLAEPLAIYTEGYWGFEKMGEFLPVDYSPEPPSVPSQKP